MSLTVERSYCERPLVDQDPGFLMQQTYDFSVENNRLFLERPEWLYKATCIHCWIFPFFYTAVFFTSLLGYWKNRILQIVFLMFVGAKLNALLFYHYMEFTSHIPPEHLVPYFSAEGPYLVSIALIIYNIYNNSNAIAAVPSTAQSTQEAKAKQKIQAKTF
eukprot:CAMPEP_0194214518 /NCGR_PEP_ID=MMETSP0156-20130528/15746_1 /TAXON_ID=33649 /ORGANISM="Thalassionema nitzschioides, Strain L26-B" /LENGTH=160 /DNA_ID=CAMNT_0038942791 /DNA_START=153 /DNA_END=635 /DNA_ORIENTATION=+